MLSKTDVYTFRREMRTGTAAGRKGHLLGLGGMDGRKWLLMAAVAFLLGRAAVLGELMPFAAAFTVVVAAGGHWRTWPWAVLAALGMVTVLPPGLFWPNLAVQGGLFLLGVFLPPAARQQKYFLPLGSAALLLVVKAAFLAVSGGSTFAYYGALFEAILLALLVPVVRFFYHTVREFSGVRTLSFEESVSLFVLLAGVIAGSSEVHYGPVSLKGFLSRLVVLLAAGLGGGGVGAAAGALVGIVPGALLSAVPYMVGTYAFAGLLAGLGRPAGRFGVITGFLLGNVILTVFINDLGGLVTYLTESLLAALLFLILPWPKWQAVLDGLKAGHSGLAGEYENRLRGEIKQCLQNFQLIIQELARVMTGSRRENRPAEQERYAGLVQEVGQRVCRHCGMYRNCWERDFFRTSQLINESLVHLERSGSLSADELPALLQSRCRRLNEMALAIACLYETYRLNSYWENRLAEGQEVLLQQLKGAAQMVAALAEDMSWLSREEMPPRTLKNRLRQLGFPVYELKIWESGPSRKEIVLTRRRCADGADCRYRLAPVLSEILSGHFSTAGCSAGEKAEPACRVRFYQDVALMVETGVAAVCRAGEQVSGDSYDFVQLPEGCFAALLSDGTGSGEAAARQSRGLVNLMVHMLQAGLPLDTALKTVNGLMLMGQQDCFATLDIMLLDLYQGAARFYKLAAPPALLVRGRRVLSIGLPGAPPGVVGNLEVVGQHKQLQEGDLVVMVTDGVWETGGGMAWLEETLPEIAHLKPQEVAELLLNLARGRRGGAGHDEHDDDMTVLALRVSAR